MKIDETEVSVEQLVQGFLEAVGTQRQALEVEAAEEMRRRLRGGVGETLGTSVDVDTRSIYLFGTIDEEASYKLFVALSQLERMDGDVSIILNSPGGEVHNGFAIYDRIKASPCWIRIVGYGAVQSAAATILQAGDVRVLSPNARLMVHQLSLSGHMDVTREDLKALSAETDELAEIQIRLLKPRFKGTLKELRELVDKETFMTPKEAVRLGFADEVLK